MTIDAQGQCGRGAAGIGGAAHVAQVAAGEFGKPGQASS